MLTMTERHSLSDAPFGLTGRTVHIWELQIRASDPVTAQFERVLRPEEAARAARFRFERLQRSFILTRGALRVLLGHYLDSPPDHVQFKYSANGKPSLTDSAGLQFNTSHSGEIALFAFTLESEVGVDVEQIRPLEGMRELAGRYFCPEEASDLMALPAHQRQAAFFRCWTRKEAFIKATGEGLSAPLDSFRVTLGAGDARLLHRRHDAAAARAWTLHDVPSASQYAAAVAYRDAERPVDVRPLVTPADLLRIEP